MSVQEFRKLAEVESKCPIVRLQSITMDMTGSKYRLFHYRGHSILTFIDDHGQYMAIIKKGIHTCHDMLLVDKRSKCILQEELSRTAVLLLAYEMIDIDEDEEWGPEAA